MTVGVVARQAFVDASRDNDPGAATSARRTDALSS